MPGNHDQVRVASRVAKGCERLAAMLLRTWRGTPWLPLQEKWIENDVERQASDGRSLLQLYRGMISLRRKSSALVEGSYHFLFAQKDNLGAYCA